MSKDKLDWSADGNHLPTIKPHTKAKHHILEDYVIEWISTLCGNNMGKRKTVTLIDGFCGGGAYKDTENSEVWAGSPLRIIRAVERGLQIVRTEKSKPNYELNVKFIFIDNDPSSIACLKLQMQQQGLDSYLNDSSKCEFICSEFENVVHQVCEETKNRRGSSFFFIDPYGYTDVSMHSIREIISLNTSEVLFTFMLDFFNRFLSLRDSSLKNAIQMLEAEEYFTLADIHHDTQSQQSYLRNETLRLFRNKGLAPFVYSFALLQNSSLVTYYLVHLASNPSAQRVMKEVLWRKNNIDLFYQFEFRVFGLGFRTPEYYEVNQRIFNIKDTNAKASIEILHDELMPIIRSHTDGILFSKLHVDTMQTNPATMEHYMMVIDEQREFGEIEIIRNEKITKAKNFNSQDVIIKSKQYKIFDFKQFKGK